MTNSMKNSNIYDEIKGIFFKLKILELCHAPHTQKHHGTKKILKLLYYR